MIGRIFVISGLTILLYWGAITETFAAGTDARTDSRKQSNVVSVSHMLVGV
jgi:hypothetical protein